MRAIKLVVLCLALCAAACGGSESETFAENRMEDAGAQNDSASPEMTAPDAQTDVEDDTGPGVDPNIIRFRYEPDGEGFYRTPWPSDGRLNEAGSPDMRDFPGREATVETVLEAIETDVRGFANMPVIYLAADGPMSNAPLRSPSESTAGDSPIQLIDLSETGCGQRVPLDMVFTLNQEPFADPFLLRIKNSIGTVLEPGHPYGLVVMRSFGAEEQRETARAPAFDLALRGDGTPHGDSLEPLRRCLPELEMDLEEVAIATVFTPQDPIEEMRRLRDFVMDPERVPTRGLVDWRRSDAWSRKGSNLRTYVGHVEMPIFQTGPLPYSAEGSGALVFGEDGAPVIQRWEEVEIAIQVRDLENPPPGPRPLAVYIDGTGWEPWRQLYGNWVNSALNAGFVVASFMPQFHGHRAGFGGSPEISTFNFINPPAGRTNFRQQAAETSYFLRLLREEIDGQDGLPELDTENVVYGGHSQGALCGAIVAAVESEYSSYVLNGLSSNLTLTLLYRKDPVDFRLIVRSIFGISGELDEFSPVLQLMQMGAEVVDPHNYARLWRGSEANPGGNHVFVSNGYNDATTTPRGMDHLTISGALPPIGPPGWDVDEQGIWGDLESVDLPVEGNTSSFSGEPLTIATYLNADEGHFTIHRRRFVREMALNFWKTSRTEAVPRIVSDREYQCGDGVDDDEDGAIDCEDSNCAETPPCVEGVCDDGLDEDDNGLTDCEDPRCAAAQNCIEVVCDDMLDDDGDELVDCDDPDCAGKIPCNEVECGDEIDNDNDGQIDCDDDECADSGLCRERKCVDNRDNDGDGLRDCDDPDCVNSIGCPELVCDDAEDGDNNGLVDCGDPGCAGTEACPITLELECGDGEDGDDDGLTDCEDPDCGLDPSCVNEDSCADVDLGSALGVPVFVGDLEGADDDYYAGECVGLGSGDESRDMSFLWTPPTTGTYVVSTYNTDFDTTVGIYPADCDREREIGCDNNDGPVLSSRINVNVTEGSPFVIVVSGYNKNDSGPFQLHIYPRP